MIILYWKSIELCGQMKFWKDVFDRLGALK